MANKGVYTAEAGKYSGTGVPTYHIRDVYWGREDSWNEKVYAVAGTVCGTEGRVNWRR